MDKCLHQGNRSGHLETVPNVGLQGIEPPKKRRVEKCMDCYQVIWEPVTRAEWRAELESEIREELINLFEYLNYENGLAQTQEGENCVTIKDAVRIIRTAILGANK